MSLAALTVMLLGHRDEQRVLSIIVLHTLLVAGNLGHLVLIGAAHIVAIEIDGREVKLIAAVTSRDGVVLSTSRHRSLASGIGIAAVSGLVTRVIATQCLKAEGELVSINVIAARGVVIHLRTVDGSRSLVRQITVGEGHRTALNARRAVSAFSALVILQLLD